MAVDPQRIMYVITDLQVGGVPLHLYRLARFVHQQGHHVRVVSLAAPGPVSRQLRDAGISVGSCGARNWRSLAALWRLRRELVTFRPDVVHALLFHANLACRFVGPASGLHPRQLVCEIQTVEIQQRWHLLVDGLTHWLCRLEIGNSPSVVRHLERRAGIPPHKLRVVRSSVEVERFAQALPVERAAVGVAEGQRLLLWVGRLDRIKGLADLLSAHELLNRKIAAQLVLVGDGPQKRELLDQARRTGIEGRVTFLGVRDDVPELLKACDVFVFPSYTEGMPNALLEAMAAGCPIVCSDVAGNRDLISDRRSGLMVPARSPQALADAIREILDTPSLGQRLGAQASQVARNDYDFKLICKKYLSLYQL